MTWVGVLAGGVVGSFLGHFIGSLPTLSAAPTTLLTTGRVERPPGVPLAGLRVRASRDGREAGEARLDERGAFSLNVRGDGPFDLHVTDWRAWRDPHAIDPAPPEPAVVMEGSVLGLAWGARNVLVRVASVARANVSIRVRGPDGAPAPGASVWLRSMTDQVRQTTDADGTARFEGLPVRSWRAVASLGGGEALLNTGWRDFVPQGKTVDVRVPTGIRVDVRLAGRTPADVVLGCEIPHLVHVYVELPWRPGSDGRMALFVPPDHPSLSLTATEYLERTERTTRSQRFAAGAIAVAEGTELVLEPFER